jgi:hypothetical protein
VDRLKQEISASGRDSAIRKIIDEAPPKKVEPKKPKVEMPEKVFIPKESVTQPRVVKNIKMQYKPANAEISMGNNIGR